MYRKVNYFADLFHKLAQLEWPESTKWVPEDFKKQEVFEKFPNAAVKKVLDDFGLHDFKEDILIADKKVNDEFYAFFEATFDDLASDIARIAAEIQKFDETHSWNNFGEYWSRKPREEIYEDEYNDDMVGNYALALPLEDIYNIAIELSQQAYELREKSKKENLVAPKILESIRTENNKIRFDKGASIIKAYKTLIKKLNDYFDQPKLSAYLGEIDYYDREKIDEALNGVKIEKTPQFSAFSKRGGYKIVFSTKLEDLVGISSRGVINCQSLFWNTEEGDVQPKAVTEHTRQLVGTILSRYIGVIFIASDKTKHFGRGSKMLYRALVRVVLDTKTNGAAILLDEIYPAETEAVAEAMLQSLKRKAIVPVYLASEIKEKEEISERFHIHEEEEIPTEYISYQDNPINFTPEVMQKLKHSKRWQDRYFAAERLPIGDIVDMLNDPEENVQIAVITRLKNNKHLRPYIINAARDDDPDIRRLVADSITDEQVPLMMRDPNAGVRMIIAKRADPEILHQMFPDSDEDITRQVLKKATNRSAILNTYFSLPLESRRQLGALMCIMHNILKPGELERVFLFEFNRKESPTMVSEMYAFLPTKLQSKYQDKYYNWYANA